MKALFQFVARNPWLYVVLAFVVLIGAWLTLILIAAKNPPREFEVVPTPQQP
jgi:hypothetical protein